MQVLAFLTFGAYPPGEEQAEIASVDLVALGVPGVIRNVAARDGSGLGQVLVLAVAAGPLVVPDIEDCARLRRRLGFHGRGIDLCSRGALLPADDLLDLLLCSYRAFIICCRERDRSLLGFHPRRRHGWRRSCLDVGHGVCCSGSDKMRGSLGKLRPRNIMLRATGIC
jgi:hypothetical protein